MTRKKFSLLKTCVLFFLFILIVVYQAFGQKENLPKTSAGFPINYDEALVGTYTLPDALTLNDGTKVNDSKTWEEKRRPELISLLEKNQYGTMPPKPAELSFHVFDKGTPVLDGKAVRKQVTVYFTKDTSSYKMDLLIYLPVTTEQPVPLFFMISFTPNVLTVDDPGIVFGEMWTREGKKIPASQGKAFAKLDVVKFISQGIGVATVYYGDIEPDFKGGIKFGIRGHYLKPGTSQPAPDEWGAISAWSWGLSRAMDYFETDKSIDVKRIALYGVSRLGKTVLWTGARDTRFKMIIASCSGEGGAALSRRDYGENIKHLTDTSRYFYQFAANYHNYAGRVNDLPVDAHMLVALIAPRPLLLQTGSTDYWSDPKGEFLSAVAAEGVYKLYGLKGPGRDVMPEAGDSGMLNTLGYYMHSGGHGTLPSDWDIYMAFIKKYL
jgi:hypothetical protein